MKPKSSRSLTTCDFPTISTVQYWASIQKQCSICLVFFLIKRATNWVNILFSSQRRKVSRLDLVDISQGCGKLGGLEDKFLFSDFEVFCFTWFLITSKDKFKVSLRKQCWLEFKERKILVEFRNCISDEWIFGKNTVFFFFCFCFFVLKSTHQFITLGRGKIDL